VKTFHFRYSPEFGGKLPLVFKGKVINAHKLLSGDLQEKTSFVKYGQSK
jgi:hypothetical protein